MANTFTLAHNAVYIEVVKVVLISVCVYISQTKHLYRGCLSPYKWFLNGGCRHVRWSCCLQPEPLRTLRTRPTFLTFTQNRYSISEMTMLVEVIFYN